MKSVAEKFTRLAAIALVLSVAASCDDGDGTSGPTETGNFGASSALMAAHSGSSSSVSTMAPMGSTCLRSRTTSG